MNKNIFRSRTVIGAVCILLAVLVCFGGVAAYWLTAFVFQI